MSRGPALDKLAWPDGARHEDGSMWLLAALFALGTSQAEPRAPSAAGSASASQPPAAVLEGLVVVAPKRDAHPEPDWAGKLNFDTRGTFQRSDTPYLRERPSNGCKPMAGGATSVVGASGVAGGVVCSLRF